MQGAQGEESRSVSSKYEVLEQLLNEKRDHDEIMAHIEKTGITPEESNPDFYKTVGDSVTPPLLLAVKFSRLDIMNSLIQKGFDPHTSYIVLEDRRLYLILEACEDGNIDVIKSLMDEHHVDLKVVDADENTAIMNVLNSDIEEDKMLDIVKYLVEKGTDVTETADLAAAVSRDLDEISKYLISCGGRMRDNPPDYWSPLTYAAQTENVPIAKMLVEAGANIEGSEGRKLLLIAAAQDNLEMVEYCNSIDIDLDWEGELIPALHVTIEGEAYDVARYLVVDANVSLERKGPDDQTAFQTAFMRSSMDFVQLFMEAGYNPNKEECLNENHEEEDLQLLAEAVRDSVAERTLQDHCVFQVRKSLGKNANTKVQQLLLPANLKDMVQLDHIPRSTETPIFFPSIYRRRNRVRMIVEQYDSIYEEIINAGADSVHGDP